MTRASLSSEPRMSRLSTPATETRVRSRPTSSTAIRHTGSRELLQLRVLCLGLLVDGNVGIGVFPERKEVLVGGERPDAGGIGIRTLRSSRLQGIGTSDP